MPSYIYKTTNLINGKFYIGKHKAEDIRSSSYLGSGIALKSAIVKYGPENFTREILFEFENEIDAYKKEAEIVTDTLVSDTLCYNITVGGAGSYEHTLSTIEKIKVARARQKITPGHRKAISKGLKGKSKSPSHLANLRKPKHADHGKRVSLSKTGVPQTAEAIENNRKAQNKTKHCVHCNTEHKIAAYGRWHGHNCKERLDAN